MLGSIFYFKKLVSSDGPQPVRCYCGGHSNNTILATGYLPIAIVGCGPLL
jgi:hypothetical protein